MFGLSLEDARERYWETFDIILKAWTQNEFSHKGKFYRIENGSLHLKPLQKPMPPMWVAASSDETLRKSGELGYPIMGIPFARSSSIVEVKEKNDIFRESYLRAGHKEEPDMIVALHVYLHENEEHAIISSRLHYERVLDYLKISRRPGSRVPDFDTVKREKLVVFAAPERAEEIFREYEKIGVTHVICMVNFGGVPMPDVRRTLELMSKEVMPKFQ
jgi:alkanesulfonate monooxygenase SsuD/methylene tetrahydromethanopterin reductase-like flavin-dependent oxidoreductase (luciferase family)